MSPVPLLLSMKKRRKRKSHRGLLVALVIALIAIVAVIVWKQYEYAASADLYDSLRGMTGGGL